MALKPLNDSFLFSFFAATEGGKFIERNRGNIILTNQDLTNQATYARWGKVEEVGKDVVDFKVGDIVLIEALQWTTEFRLDGRSFWKSDASKVIALADDESVTYTYG